MSQPTRAQVYALLERGQRVRAHLARHDIDLQIDVHDDGTDVGIAFRLTPSLALALCEMLAGYLEAKPIAMLAPGENEA